MATPKYHPGSDILTDSENDNFDIDEIQTKSEKTLGKTREMHPKGALQEPLLILAFSNTENYLEIDFERHKHSFRL